MSRHFTAAAVVALAIGVSACASAPPPGGLTSINNPSIYSVHQPVVQRTQYVIDLATSGDGLAPSELGRLHGWLESIDARYGDRISIDEPQGYPSLGARQDIARVAADYGLLLTEGAPVLNGTVQPGTIRVIASRATASVPGCPAWEVAEIHPSINTSANYGCATYSNLAAMIANPEDLVLGQDGSGTGNAATATRAIRVHREGQPTGRQGLPQTATPGGR